MLMQEGNLQGKFQGKSLNDISFEDILHEDTITVAPDTDHQTTNIEDDFGIADVVQDFADDGVDVMRTRKKPRTSSRKKWSGEEEEELRKYFPEYFNKRTSRTCPTRKECYYAIAQSKQAGGSLHNRGWEMIKKKINNWVKKN